MTVAKSTLSDDQKSFLFWTDQVKMNKLNIHQEIPNIMIQIDNVLILKPAHDNPYP